ncbi:MAG: hypothetical protein U0V70_13550 [Terriglobia bacterium]
MNKTKTKATPKGVAHSAIKEQAPPGFMLLDVPPFRLHWAKL